MSDDQLHPWAGILLGALLAGGATGAAGVVLDTPSSIAVGLALGMPILLLYGAGDAFDRDGYFADHSMAVTVTDMTLIAVIAALFGVASATATATVTGSTIIAVAVTAGATFLGGFAALYIRRSEYYTTA